MSKFKGKILSNYRSLKDKIKKYRYSQNPIIRTAFSGLYISVRAIKALVRLCVDADYRSISFQQLFWSKNVHQTTTCSGMDRYPIIFSACRDYFEGKKDLKFLSFGCSTGEEVITLRNYFPTAQIIGSDVNKHSLAICRKLPVDDKITFLYSKPSEILKYGMYDAIFCMAVLQRKPLQIELGGVKSLKEIYPFEKFEKQIIELDKLVKPQGLLVVHYSQYSVWDTSVASKYKPLGIYNQDDYGVPVFDRNSNIITAPVSFKTICIKLHE